nr:helix-turn-helix transcriptional regulator [uncultured Oscillibacter sp.]
MKKLQVYYGSLALKDLRKAKGMTVAQLAALIPCSERTVNRFEASNWTSNPQIAQRLAEVFSIPFQQLFIPTDQHFLECVASTIPTVSFGAPLEGLTYYLLYVRRISWLDANIWGKTMWIGNYDQFHELRKLHMLSGDGIATLYAAGILAISSEKEWNSFFYRATIGHTYKVVVAEDCLRTCAPYALYQYAVHRRALYSDKLPWDYILLGDYTNLPDVFSVRC